MKKSCLLLSNRNEVYLEYVRVLEKELTDAGLHVEVAHYGASDLISGSFDAKKILQFVEVFKNSSIRRIISNSNIVIVSPGLFALVPALISRFSRSKVIYFLHEPRLQGPGVYPYAVNIFQRIMLTLSDHLLVFSRAAFNMLSDNGKSKALEVRLPGIVKANRMERTGKVLCIGSVAKNKRLDWFVGLAERMPEIEFVLAVNGTVDEESFHGKSLANLDIIIGKVDYAEYYRLISTSRFVVLPYEYSTQSGVFVDALGCGTPVICSNVGSFREFVVDGKNGYVIEVNNFVDRAMEVLEMDHDQEYMFTECIESYKKNFSVNQLVTSLLSIL